MAEAKRVITDRLSLNFRGLILRWENLDTGMAHEFCLEEASLSIPNEARAEIHFSETATLEVSDIDIEAFNKFLNGGE